LPIFTILTLLIHPVLALAQSSSSGLDPEKAITQYVHDSWQTDQGLPQNSVNAVLQTRDGYLWLGTQEGLVRFDAVRMTVFDRRNTPALKTSWITGLAEVDGSLWISTWGGGLTRLRNGVFTNYRAPQGLPDDHLNTVVADPDGSLWIGSAHHGLIHYTAGKFINCTFEAGLPTQNVTAIVPDTGGGVWIGTAGNGIARFVNGRFRFYDVGDGLASDYVAALYRDHRGVLWIGTEWGMSRLADGRFRNFTTDDGLPAMQVRAIVGDDRDVIWVGTELSGLTRYWNGRFTRYTTTDGLSNSTPVAFRFDREGGLWIGTDERGLHRLQDARFTTYSTEEGLPAEVVWSVLAARDSGVWAGTEGGGLVHLRNGRAQVYGPAEGLTGAEVHALYEDQDGTLWIGTPAGLHRWRNGRITRYAPAPSLRKDVWAITRTRDSSLWLGTAGGLTRIQGKQITLFGEKQGLGRGEVQALLESRNGTLFVGTGHGLYRMVADSFVAMGSRSTGLGQAVFALHEDEQGVLWVGTDGSGLQRVEHGVVTAYTMQDGLADDVVFSILEDANHNLWMSSNKGVFEVSKRLLNAVAAGRPGQIVSTLYGTSDGMKIGEANGGFQPAGTVDSEGTLWFPTLRGIAGVRPGAPRVTAPVRAYLEEIRVNNVMVPVAEGLVLPAGSTRLEFRFTALSLHDAKHLRFRYRLEGVDPDWIDAAGGRVASYTHIPGGHYRFLIEVLGEGGEWARGAGLGFRIKLHVYQTWWFIGLSALAVMLTGFGLHWLRLRRIRQHEAVLTALVDTRTQSLQQEIGERQSIEAALRRSHEELEARVRARTADLHLANVEWKHTFDSIPSPIIITDLNGRIKQLNQTAAQQASIPSQDSVPGLIGEIDGEPWQCTVHLLRRVAGNAEGCSEQVRCDVTGRRWDVAARLIEAPSPGDERVITIARDITAEVELQESLRKGETMAAVGELVAGMAHEVRNPLFSISANLDAFEARHGVLPEARQYLDVLRREMNRLTSVVQHLVDYVKPPALNPVPMTLDRVVDAAIHACTPLAERHRVRTRNQVDPDLPLVMMDPDRMTQVFTHLLSLAVYHSSPGGQVEVEARMRSAERRWIECLLTDEGRERATEDLPWSLQPFLARGSDRIGLGVSLVQLTIEQHGGTIAATTRPDGGTVVRILLPVARGQGEARKGARVRAEASDTGR